MFWYFFVKIVENQEFHRKSRISENIVDFVEKSIEDLEIVEHEKIENQYPNTHTNEASNNTQKIEDAKS